MASGEVAIHVDGLHKSYDGTTVLNDVSFDVRRGRVTGLLGRNGAGKTTTFKILLGLTRPDKGIVRCLGRSKINSLAPRRVGVAMDALGFYPGASVRRELQLWARNIGVGSDRVDEVVELVGLSDHPRKDCAKLSTGQRQRLRLATSLLSPDVELLVLDEPANGLDPEGIRWMRTLIRELADQGKTILLSSHGLAEVEQVVDDVLLLEQRLLHAGSLAELTGSGVHTLEDRFFEIVGER